MDIRDAQTDSTTRLTVIGMLADTVLKTMLGITTSSFMTLAVTTPAPAVRASRVYRAAALGYE
jgi:hypothetical protein